MKECVYLENLNWEARNIAEGTLPFETPVLWSHKCRRRPKDSSLDPIMPQLKQAEDQQPLEVPHLPVANQTG